MAEEKVKKKKSTLNPAKIFSFAFLVLNFIVVGGGAFAVYTSTLGYVDPVTTEDDLNSELEEFRRQLASAPVLYTLGTIDTNLNGLPRRFVRAEVNLEMLDEEGFEEVIGKSSESKDAVVRILNAKNFENLDTVQGKLHLKNDIITVLNSFLDRGVVKNVYFSNFVVQ